MIRKAVQKDISAIQRIRSSVNENKLTSRKIRDEDILQAITATGRGWVAEKGEQVVGFAIGNTQTGNIWALFVDPDYEKQGVGRALFKTMVRWLSKQDLDKLYLSTEPNTRAEKFYTAAGWTKGRTLSNGEVRFNLKL